MDNNPLQGMLAGEDVNRSLAAQFGLPIYADLAGFQLPREYYKKVPYAFAKKHLVMLIKEESGKLLVAVADPLNLEPLEELRLMLDRDVKAVYSPRDTILNAINEAYRQESGAASELIAQLGESEGRDGEIEIYDLLDA